MIFCPIMCMYISCVGLCVHGFMNPLPSWFACGFFFSDVLTYCAMLQAFICYCSLSDVYDVSACARVCAFYWHCSAQLSMFNMEKHYRNKIIIIIIIIIMDKHHWLHGFLCCSYGQNTIIWQQQNVRYSQCPWFPASCSSISLSSLWCTQNFPVSVWHIITPYMQLPGSCKAANILF